MKYKILILALVLVFGLFSEGKGQSCIQLLDSAQTFLNQSPAKAKFYASRLLQELDSGNCATGIGLAGLYNNAGLVFWQLNDKRRGLDAFNSGLNIEIQSKDSLGSDLLGVYFNLSTLHQDLGQYESSGKFLDLAGRIVSRHFLNDLETQAVFKLRKGVFLRETGNFGQSIEFLEEAISDTEDLMDSLNLVIQIELGTTYRHSGDLAKSEEVLLRASEKARVVDELQFIKAIDRLSSLKLEQGEYSDSENYLLFNLQRVEEKYPKNPVLKMEALNSLGILYYKLNDLGSADKYLTQGLSTAEEIRNAKPYLLNNLGTVYLKNGNVDTAKSYFLESLGLFEKLFGTLNPDYASCLNNLAGIYEKEGDLGEALNYYTKVLDLDKVIYGSDHSRYATSLNNVALLYLKLGHLELAGSLLNSAKKIRKNALGTSHPLYFKTVNDLGLYYLLNSDTLSAMQEFNEALNSEIRHMQDVFPVLTDKQRKLYFDETRNNVERFSSLAFAEGFINSEYATDALNHFINIKGILFYASDKMRKLIQESGDVRLTRMFENWKDKKYKLAQAYLLSEEERARLGISIDELEELCQSLEKELSRSFKMFSDQEKSAYHRWEEISSALPDSSAVVDIIQYRNYKIDIVGNKIDQGFEDFSSYVGFVILPDSVLKPVKWSRFTDFEKSLNFYKNAMKYGIQDSKSYGVFWEPIEEAISGTRKIYFSPDGVFHKLNPGVFYDSESNDYVVDRYDIVNVTSGKDLIYNEKRSIVKEARIFGNPDFSKLSIASKLAQLPGAEQEANEVAGILTENNWANSAAYFAEATEDRVKRMRNPGIIHIATHGYFEEDPDLVDPLHSSGLFLSKGTNDADDGLLSAYEAMNLILDETSVVVLAACETGRGTVKNGEGVFGLQRAFLVAGAENVLISLVKINDEAARKFMNLFYEELIIQEDAQLAFFEAREKFKQIDNNPYNWGAYILVSKS